MAGEEEGGTSNAGVLQRKSQESAGFARKTELAKKKWMEKMSKKHLLRFRVVWPTPSKVCDIYARKDNNSAKWVGLRSDTLAQIVGLADVAPYAHGRPDRPQTTLVVETPTGIILSTLAHRLQGHGQVFNVFTGQQAHAASWRYFNFEERHGENIFAFPILWVREVLEERQRRQQQEPQPDSAAAAGAAASASSSEEAAAAAEADTELPVEEEGAQAVTKTEQNGDEIGEDADSGPQWRRKEKPHHLRIADKEFIMPYLREEAIDSLIIATKFDPKSILLPLLQVLRPGRPFVVHCEHAEPLLECMRLLSTSHNTVRVMVTETWTRPFQVLPGRTHPVMNMYTSGGYLLSGFKVLNNPRPEEWGPPIRRGGRRKPAKRVRVS